nr:hypothetical protein [Tanacetum cinerariifolium]
EKVHFTSQNLGIWMFLCFCVKKSVGHRNISSTLCVYEPLRVVNDDFLGVREIDGFSKNEEVYRESLQGENEEFSGEERHIEANLLLLKGVVAYITIMFMVLGRWLSALDQVLH